MRDFGVTILILALLVGLGAAGEYNYKRNQAAEEASGGRKYRGYSDAEIASLIRAYEREVETLEARYDAAKSREIQTRGGGLIDQQVEEFERTRKQSAATRSMGADVAQKEAVLRELRREQSMRGGDPDGLMLHLKRLVSI
jgi:hypothetical protein